MVKMFKLEFKVVVCTNLGVPGPDRNSCEGQQGWMYHITPTATQTMQQAASSVWLW
jgi:hypothetical protein